ncbi:hypothetical protein ACHAC9_07945 [Massilia sp. CMS3.1]|uniref:hypothetical protein n=1 Tax=Massilia sp. CMS3.1 TaxID=3373083 RepID=UPI003EE75EBB
MAREEFLEELSEDFPPQRIYSYDENARYLTDRRELMDAVLDGTFQTYECAVKECEFRYKISADVDFELEVFYRDETWRKTFSYIAEAFDIAEAAYRFFIVVPRILGEAEPRQAVESARVPEQVVRTIDADRSEAEEANSVEVIVPPVFSERGQYLSASIFRCTDDSYTLCVLHARPQGSRLHLLEKSFTDKDFAELMAKKYLELFDHELPGAPTEVYQFVYKRVTQ